MTVVIQILVAVLPALLLWLYIWKKDKQPEPTSQLIKAVLWGIMIIFPVGVVEMFLQSMFFGYAEPTTFTGTTTMAFWVAALPEEAFKLFALWMVLRNNPYFDEHFDGIVYAVCIGLGFAAVENIGYIIGEEDWGMVAVSRALLAVPGHYAFAVLMGFYYSVYHFVNHSKTTAACIFLVPWVAHGIYDALAMTGIVDAYVGGVCTIILIYFCVRMHKFARKKVIAQVERDNGCNI